MLELTLEEISRASGGQLFYGDPSKRITGVSIDSRTIKPNHLFISLKGEHTDGHNFLREVKKKSVAASLIRKDYPSSKIPRDLPFIRTRDPLKSLGDIARYYRLKFNLPIVAITGSSGKTTVKEMIAKILSSKLRVLKTEGNFNNVIGLPLTIFGLKDTHEVAVLEMATNTPGEIEYLTQISCPSIGVITNINPVHLEGLRDIKGVSKEKETLLLNLPEGAKAILNYDDKYIRKMGKRFRGEVVTYGLEKRFHFWADKIRYGKKINSFRLNGKEEFLLPLFGKANLYNALAAIATTSIFKIPLKKMEEILKSLKSLPHRLEVLKMGKLKIIDDTYNANPASFRLAIDTLMSLPGKGRAIVVAGDMLELGKISSHAHFELGDYIGKKGIDFLVGVGKWKKAIVDGVRKAGIEKGHIFCASSPEEAAKIVLNIVRPYDKILFKASRKIELERAINALSSSLSSY